MATKTRKRHLSVAAAIAICGLGLAGISGGLYFLVVNTGDVAAAAGAVTTVLFGVILLAIAVADIIAQW